MRTTITIADETFERVKEVASQSHQSVSSLISRFTVMGLAQLGTPLKIVTDPATGLPTISIGRNITAEEVAEAIAE